ncbi:sel1 repeat family protein [Hymenobacter norwichensis]|uniref:sel1 repeat family protein n=1 Tax=Hymenobacter norwichensis TaxID=223903 RepID=UPI0003B4856C|nr:sel1 repeat family protein [Hymenobacter norwichensis]
MRGEKKYRRASEILDALYNSPQFSQADKVDLYNAYLTLIRASAYLGNHKAQLELALHYEEHNYFGVNKEYCKARVSYWYQKSCKGNIADACNSLATIYEADGKIEEAITLYEKAIELGNSLARKNLYHLQKTQQKKSPVKKAL